MGNRNKILILLSTILTITSTFKINELSSSSDMFIDNNSKLNFVYTPFGNVQGESTNFRTRSGKSIYSFRGIRYAQPPIGNLRFNPPIMIKPWNNHTVDATQEGPACLQPNFSYFETSEDCLRLNIYTTKIPNEFANPQLPVVVYFHSGGFYRTSAQSSFIGPQYLLETDLVLVTVNYRLGILGFLNSADGYASRNNGLKDQVMALKFIKINIDSFGGDSNRITVMGYGSGAIAVALHLISPMSQGLFHRAIIMSGSPTGTYNFSKQQTQLTKQHVETLGCPTDNSEQMLNCLRNKPADEIAMAINYQYNIDFNPLLLWQPVIEPEHYNGERFLVDDPTKLFKNGEYAKIPIMIGNTDKEFDYLAYVIAQNEKLLRHWDKNFMNMSRKIFLFDKNMEQSQNISETIRQFYFGMVSINVKLVDQLGKIYSDALVKFPVNRLAKLLANTNNNPVFYYKFSYYGIYSHFYLPIVSSPIGPVHNDDLMYLLYNSRKFPLFEINDPAVRTIERMHKLWTDFIQFGHPTPTRGYVTDGVLWEPFTAKNNKYMEIKCTLRIKKDLYTDRYALWETLFSFVN